MALGYRSSALVHGDVLRYASRVETDHLHVDETGGGLGSAGRADAAVSFHAGAYPILWRIIAGTLVAASRANLLVVLILGLLAQAPIPLFAWLRALIVLSLIPAVAAWLIERAMAVDVEVRRTGLVVPRQDLQLEIPYDAIGGIEPWTVPLPGPGFWLRMRSGRRFRYGLQVTDPTPLLAALANVGYIEAVHTAIDHPTVIYARAKYRAGRWHWYHRVAKFLGFALLPTAVMFNLHQHVAYGGLLGQYYLEGLTPYFKTFSIYWGLMTVYLILYASVWRGLAEGAALATAWLAPGAAARVRHIAEVACRVLYYVGVPVGLLLPFLQ
ncbi:MAG: hypothetical protein ACHQ9S_11510 [Candidatus Binatia bacterium]